MRTYGQIATDYALWGEYVDPGDTMTREEFDALTTEEKVAMQAKCFGPDNEVE